MPSRLAGDEWRTQCAELQHGVPGYPVRYRLPRCPSREQRGSFSASGFLRGA